MNCKHYLYDGHGNPTKDCMSCLKKNVKPQRDGSVDIDCKHLKELDNHQS